MISLIFALFFEFGCGGATGEKNNGGGDSTAAQKNAKTVFVLFDVSDSTNSQETRAKYLESFNRVADSLSDGDVMVADFINDNPLGQSTFSINEQFPVFTASTDNDLKAKKERKAFDEKINVQREAVKEKAKQLFAADKGLAKKTKIFESNELAERVFKSYERPKKLLVVFSDMLEYSEKGNFEKQKLNAESIRKILDGEKKTNQLPVLTGVKVYVVGAGTGRAAGSFNDIENFWIEYYRACGAELGKENYGAALLKFDE